MAIDIKLWLKNNTADLAGRTVVVTGAAGGLGSKLCRYLAELHAHVIMLDCDLDKANTVKDAIMQEFPASDLEIIKIDLNDLQAVHDIATALGPRRIDFLILNAGVYNVPLTQSSLGYNNVFQINFISHYYLTKALLPTLARTNGKVVAVSSIAHNYAKLDNADIDYTKVGKKTKIYGNSKRFLMYALAELFKERTDVRLAVVHPGVTLTPMTNHYHPAINWLVTLLLGLICPKPEVAALNILAGLFRDVGNDEWLGPKTKGIWGEPTVTKLTDATDEERAEIFKIAESICQVLDNVILAH